MVASYLVMEAIASYAIDISRSYREN